MHRSSFALWAGSAIIAMACAIHFFPMLLYGAVSASNCKGVGGACGAVAVVFGLFGRLLLVAIFAIVMGILVWRRARGASLSGLWAFPVLVWILASLPFLQGVNNFWGANFSAGLLYIAPPLMLVAMIVLVVFLSVYDSPPDDDAERLDLKAAWWIAWISAAVTVLMNFASLSVPFALIPGLEISVMQLFQQVQLIPYYALTKPLGMIGFPVLLTQPLLICVMTGAFAYILYASRLGSGRGGAGRKNAQPNEPSPRGATPAPASGRPAAFGQRRF